MSSRPGIVASKTIRANGGQSPNAYVPLITAEMRVYWPPLATDEQIENALNMVVDQARRMIKGERVK